MIIQVARQKQLFMQIVLQKDVMYVMNQQDIIKHSWIKIIMLMSYVTNVYLLLNVYRQESIIGI